MSPVLFETVIPVIISLDLMMRRLPTPINPVLMAFKVTFDPLSNEKELEKKALEIEAKANINSSLLMVPFLESFMVSFPFPILIKAKCA